MAERFSEDIVHKAFLRAGWGCECELMHHEHSGRCCKIIAKANRGEANHAMGWEAHSKSGKYLDSLDDCIVMCWKCHIMTL